MPPMIRKKPVLTYTKQPIMVQANRKNSPVFKEKIFSLRDFWEKRNHILIRRDVMAVGDYFMHRMLFEDIKRLNPELVVHFGCQPKYFECMQNHPFLDKIVDYGVNPYDYIVHYDTNTACTRYESDLGPKAIMHRSDIWANHCGFELQSHNMHIKVTPECVEWANQQLLKQKGKPNVLLCVHSANQII